ncbi:hypothetical protein Tco_1103023 [Tanacetum coccineum]
MSVKYLNYVNLTSLSEEQPNERTPSPHPRKKSLSPPQAPSKSISSKSTHYTSSSSPSESPTPTHVAPPPKLYFVIPIKLEPQELPPFQVSPNDPYVQTMDNWPLGPSNSSPPPRVSKPPLENRFETYVKAKDLDLWHIILNSDFPPVARNKETQVLETVPFEQQDDDLKKKLAKNNEAKMVLYNALPKKEYERIFMCKTAKDIWQSLLITHQGPRINDSKASTSGTKNMIFVGSSAEKATDGSTIKVHGSTLPGSVSRTYGEKGTEHIFSPPMSSRSDFVITRKKLIQNSIDESKNPSLEPSPKSDIGYVKTESRSKTPPPRRNISSQPR